MNEQEVRRSTRRGIKHSNYVGRDREERTIYLALVCGHPVGDADVKRCRKCYIEFSHNNNNKNWHGGKHITSYGYERMYVGPREYILTHRLIAERALGRPLKSNEVVHHINMNKLDNRNSNLLICNQKYHMWLEYQYAKRYAQEHFYLPQVGRAASDEPRRALEEV